MARKAASIIPIVTATVIAIGVALGVALTSPKQISSQAQLDALQRTAEQACRCERSAGKPGTCWSDYRKRTEGLVTAQQATACEPISTEFDCFLVNGRESCIVTGRNGSQFCSADEAKAYESAYIGAAKRSLRGHPDDIDRALKAALASGEQVMDAIHKGFVPPADPSSQGCS